MANPKLNEFHALRIQMKDCVIPSNSCSSLRQRFNDIIHRTVEIQGSLGELQDTVFNQKTDQTDT